RCGRELAGGSGDAVRGPVLVVLQPAHPLRAVLAGEGESLQRRLRANRRRGAAGRGPLAATLLRRSVVQLSRRAQPPRRALVRTPSPVSAAAPPLPPPRAPRRPRRRLRRDERHLV